MQPAAQPARRVRRKRANRYHHGDLRAAAVAAALASLDRGDPVPALRDLAAACGVAHPSLYRHFGNAEDLTLSVAAACFREFGAFIEAAVARERTPVARLKAGCEASIRWGVAHPTRYALMMGPELAGKQHHAEFFHAARDTFDGLVRAVAACGVRDALPVAHTMICALHGLTDFLRKGRTIPNRAASLDEQVLSMVSMAVSYALASAPRGAPAADGGRGVITAPQGRRAGKIRNDSGRTAIRNVP
jgi:AcrR family transcriptional regulator